MLCARKRRIEGLNLLETQSDDFFHEDERDKSVPQQPTFVSRVAVAILVQDARFFQGCFFVSRVLHDVRNKIVPSCGDHRVVVSAAVCSITNSKLTDNHKARCRPLRDAVEILLTAHKLEPRTCVASRHAPFPHGFCAHLHINQRRCQSSPRKQRKKEEKKKECGRQQIGF